MAEDVKGLRQSPVTAGKIEVEPSRLADELERIRREAAMRDMEVEAEASGVAAARVKATLSNIILFVSDHGLSISNDKIDTLITELCIARPSRLFVVQYCCGHGDDHGSSGSGLKTAVASRCVLANSGAHVCSEEIYITVEPHSLPVISNLLLSLLVPDVETALVVLCDPSLENLQSRMPEAALRFVSLLRNTAKVTDLLIYDSSLFSDYSRSVEVLFRSGDFGVLPSGTDRVLRDLTWRRTEKWRKLIAEQFDAEKLRESNDSISHIRFRYRTSALKKRCSGVASDAILLSGWFAWCLSLPVESFVVGESSGERGLISRAGLGKEILFTFSEQRVEMPGDTEGLSRVEVMLEPKDGPMRVVLDRSRSGAAIHVSTEISASGSKNRNHCELLIRRASDPADSLDRLIRTALEEQNIEEGFEQVLSISRKLSGLLCSG